MSTDRIVVYGVVEEHTADHYSWMFPRAKVLLGAPTQEPYVFFSDKAGRFEKEPDINVLAAN